MTRDVNQLKKEARRAEQRADWDRAIQLYRNAIRTSEEAGDVAPDVSLYNRVGDLYRRRGDTERAVHYYLEAVDQYAEQDLHTGAIALCNKILRITPDRVEVYRKLGRLHAATGLVAEARNSYLEYASRMADGGRPEARQEAFLELARITEDDDLYLRTVEELEKGGRTDQAVEALRELWERRRERDGDTDEVRRRIVALDPAADPAAPGDSASGARSRDDAEASDSRSGARPPTESSAEGESAGETHEAAESAPTDVPSPSTAESPSPSPTGAPADEPASVEGDAAGEAPAGSDTGEAPAPARESGGSPPPPTPAADRNEVRLRYAEVLCRTGRDAEAVEQLEKLLSEVDPAGTPERALRGLELLDEVGALDDRWRQRARAWADDVGDSETAGKIRELAGVAASEGPVGGNGEPTRPPKSAADPGGTPPPDASEPEPTASEGLTGDPGASEPVAESSESVAGTSGDDEAPASRDEEPEEGGAKLDELLVGFRARAEETVGQADPEEHLEMGQALHDMDRLDDAIREFQVAARAPEAPIRAFELLGAAFLEKGLPSVAVRVLTRALRIPGHQDCDLLQVLYLLGLAREELGDAEAALDCYERVYSIDIDFRDVADRMRAMAR